LLQGTLDMLILRTLLFGPAHGHQIAKHIQRTTDDLLQVEHGSLYPALHRLERKGWLAAKWEPAGKDLKREYKYYRLTAAGKKQLMAEEFEPGLLPAESIKRQRKNEATTRETSSAWKEGQRVLG
jgi:transcriptional regulator